MTKFGFSAFLKFISLRDRRQATAARQRLVSTRGGFDFHRSFRLRAGRLMSGDESLDGLIAKASHLKNPTERQSLEAGLKALATWRASMVGEVLAFPSSLYISPNDEFRVTYEPDFGLRIGGVGVAIHIWNTRSVRLSAGLTYAALALARAAYRGDNIPDDVAVLSLPERRLLRLSDVADQTRARALLARRLDGLLAGIRREIPPEPPRPKPQPEDRPPR